MYGVGIFSALLSPGFIVRYGAVRVSQFVLLATRRTEATGLGAGMMFTGVMVMPSAFSVAIAASGAYAAAYAAAGILAAVSGLLLLGAGAPARPVA